MTVYLITGVSGYLGGRIVEALSKDPETEKIIGVDIVEPKRSSALLDFHKMDVRDDAMRKLAADNKVDVVIHLAFVLNPLYNLVKMHSIDVWGMDNALRTALACGAKRMFVTSSTSSYGALPDNPEPLTEDSPLRAPKSFQYAYDKALIDRMCRKFMDEHPEIKFSLVRPCIVLGPNVDNYISRALLSGYRGLIDGCDPNMQFVHEDDVAAACLALLKAKAHGVFNIVGDGVMRLSEIWGLVSDGKKPMNTPAWLAYPFVEFMWEMKIKLIEAPSAQIDFLRWPWWATGDKIKAEIGFKPTYSSREAFAKFLNSKRK